MNIEDNVSIANISQVYNNYRPAYNNLFSVEIMTTNDASEYNLKNYIKFHAVDVNIGEDKLNLTRNNVTQKFHLNPDNNYQRADIMTIIWRESDDWRVKKYHEDWVSCFYNKEKDTYISYPVSSKTSGSSEKRFLYRTFRIILPRIKKTSDFPSYSFPKGNPDLGILEDASIYKYNKKNIESNIIEVNGAIPTTTGSFGLSWKSSPDIITHSMSYYIEDWHWVENEEG